MIYDFYDDATGALLREILTENPSAVPECVTKSAALVPSEEFRADKTLFAWGAQRKYPCDTPEDTWLSYQYFQKTAHLVPFQYHELIENSFRDAAAIHDLDLGFGESKQASTSEADTPDDAFLLVHRFDGMTASKMASEGALPEEVFAPAGEGDWQVRLYPVNTKEAAEFSVLTFPRFLVGELGQYRSKVASGLVDACERYGINLTYILEDEMRPMKRSHLLAHISQRIGIIDETNQLAARQAMQEKTAAYGGAIAGKKVSPFDAKVKLAYQEILKLAYQEPLPAKFWRHFETLDKAAGFDAYDGVTPVTALKGRELDDDMVKTHCKMAGQIMLIPQILEKVSAEVWSDIAPEILENMYDFTKVAHVLESLGPMEQQIILVQVRGF